jgi:hypothetical protein
MPHGRVTEIVPAPRERVFRLLHDYDRRLEWDTLLRAARIGDGFAAAQLHATSVCTGRWLLAGISLVTEYVSFDPPRLAAVKMIDRPPFLDSFAASIRHRDRADGSSSVEYQYHFTARPTWLAPLLHPLMAALFRRETPKRLRALRQFFAQAASANPPDESAQVDRPLA